MIAETRTGDIEAFGELWIRYERVASSLASRVSTADPDDVVAEAFLRVFQALRAGNGPIDNFRAYLCRAVRSCAVDQYRRSRRSIAAGHLENLEDLIVARDGETQSADDARSAWQSLSRRDRWIMWAHAIQGYSTAEMAGHLGVRPGTVAVWTHRARENLRAAFLGQNIALTDNAECQAHRERFVAYVRGKLSARRAEHVGAHLKECVACAAVLTNVSDVNRRFRATVWPVLPIASQVVTGGLTFGHSPRALLLRHGARLLPAKASMGSAWITTATAGAAGLVVIAVVHLTGQPATTVSPDLRASAPPADRTSLPMPLPTSSAEPSSARHRAELAQPVRRAPALSRTTAVSVVRAPETLQASRTPSPGATASTTASSPPPVKAPPPTSSATPSSIPMTTSSRRASSTFAIIVPDPSNTTGTVAFSLPSGWTATSVLVTGLANTDGVGTRFDGSNVVTLTFSGAQVDASTSTLNLTVSGDGPLSPGAAATAIEALDGAPRYTQTEPMQ